MGTITLTVEGTTVGTVAEGRGIVITKAVSEQDSARLIAAYARTYAGRWTDEDGKPRAPTIQEVLTAWSEGWINGSIAHVESVEREVAAETAANAVTKITVS
jgi:hypothetical protein